MQDHHPEKDEELNALVPVERAAPPADIDERDGAEPSNEVIALGNDPTNDGETSFDGAIALAEEENLPLPDAAPDPERPNDVHDPLDVIAPLPVDEADGPDTPPGMTSEDDDTAGSTDGTTAHDLAAQDILSDHPERAEPIMSDGVLTTNEGDAPEVEAAEPTPPGGSDESDTAPFVTAGAATAEASSSVWSRLKSLAQRGSRQQETADAVAFTAATGPARPAFAVPTEGDAAPVDGPARITCPSCGMETDDLLYCGHCGAELRREVPGSGSERINALVSRGLQPFYRWTRPRAIRNIVGIIAVLALLSLLFNNGGLALVVMTLALPLSIVWWAMHTNGHRHEPWLVLVGYGVVGAMIGALLGWLSAWVVAGQWFDTGVLNYGAAGFGSRFAEAAGGAPFLVWLVVGILVPLASIAAIIAGPVIGQRTLKLRDEILTGITVSAVLAAGMVIGATLVFVSPMTLTSSPGNSAATWTLTTIGLTVVRPLIWTLSGAMLGAATWRYLRTGAVNGIVLPAAAGVLIPLVWTLISLEVQPAGLWPEVLIGALLAIAAARLYLMTSHQAVADDRTYAAESATVVCPHCNQRTPAGAFCAHCGQSLQGEPAVPEVDAPEA